MADKFSENKAPHQGEFQQSSEKNFNLAPDGHGFIFKEPNSRNLCDQHSMQNIPPQNYGSISSLSQLPPPPPPPPNLCGRNLNTGNRFPSEQYSLPPPSNYPPLRPRSYTDAISCKQPNLQSPDYSKPPPPVKQSYCFPPPQNLLIGQSSSEGKNRHQKIGGQVTSNTKTRDIKSPRDSFEFENKDESYIQDWMNNVKKRLKAEESVRKTKEIKIIDVQKKLLRYATLIKDLKDLLEHLSDSSSAPDLVLQDQRSLMTKANKIKVEIEELRRFFGEERILKKIKENLEKRREKRLRRRKTKKERSEKVKKRKEEWKKMEEEMDERIRRENEEEKQKLEEEKMKREADTVLREVRSKQEDVVRMQKLLQALTDLRDIRKNKGEMHGYVENSKATTFFEKMKKEFETILSDQKKVYHAEEQTLKIMIEESQSSTFPSRKRRPIITPNLSDVKSNIYQIYFGKERPRIEAEKEYERSFLAAEESSEILVQRRKDWDQFLVAENSGTSVPLGWVLPNIKPNDDWKAFQEP